MATDCFGSSSKGHYEAPPPMAGFSFGEWLALASERMHRNKVAVALAKKLTRMAWGTMKHKTAFGTPRDEIMAGV
jgi:hypothetical protein